MKITPLILAAALVAVPLSAAARPDAAEGRVAVVVSIATPPGVTDAYLKGEFDKAAPRYQAIPGLIRKYFTIEPKRFGGIYYWSSKAAAQAWFNEAWTARARATYGADPVVTYYDVPLAIDGVKP
jgi:heme-degrading monooxygenase HmoA